MKMPKIIFLILLVFLPCLSFSQSVLTNSYLVEKVVDGDTFQATDGVVSFRVRIVGIDAPEKAQAYGKVAKYFLKDLVENKRVEIKPIQQKIDQYNRVLGQVFLNGQDVGIKMIQEGLAYYYRPKCQNYPQNSKFYNYNPVPYVEEENMAKKKGQKIWESSESILPCEYRKGK